VAEELLRHGYQHVYALEGGFDAWRDAGYALEAKPRAAAA
jgi:rhodanese-related sulfurtransferase